MDNEFWLYWGESPKGTPKYRAGVKALSFARKAWEDGYEACRKFYELEKGILMADALKNK